MTTDDRPFHPEQWEFLEKLRRSYSNRSTSDEADWITEGIGEDGTVRVRPLTLVDVLDWVERVCEGDVT